MQITTIGTVWNSEQDPNPADEYRPYTVKVVEYLPGVSGKHGQAIRFYLDNTEPLEEGCTYRITARVIALGPTHSDDDIDILGILIEADKIE